MNNKLKILKVLTLVLISTLLLTGCGCNKKGTSKDNENINNHSNESTKKVEEIIIRYVQSVEKRVIINSKNKTKDDDITKGVYTVAELKNKKVILKEQIPDDGWVQVDKDGKVVDYSLLVGEYTVDKYIYQYVEKLEEEENPYKMTIEKGNILRSKPDIK